MFSFIKSLLFTDENKKKGLEFLDNKQYEEAAARFKTALEKSPFDQSLLLNISQALFELKRFEEAVGYLKTAAEKASSINPVPAIMLGYALYKLDRLEEAGAALDAALKIDSKHPAAHYYMGLLNLKLGNVDVATDSFEEVISEKPTFIQARLLAIGEMYIIDSERKKAAK
ncbi:MAG TPA: tetratricopeptide repeat protein [Candidatus Wallbacteria bacterium]|nr:tetratricopeptide repeat protein [Candidatus Wallbacteria bacterium]